MSGECRVHRSWLIRGLALTCVGLLLSCSSDPSAPTHGGAAGSVAGAAGATSPALGGASPSIAGASGSSSGSAGSVAGSASPGTAGASGGTGGSSNAGGTGGSPSAGAGGLPPSIQQPPRSRAERRDAAGVKTLRVWETPPPISQPPIEQSGGLWIVSSNLIFKDVQGYVWLVEIANFGNKTVCYPEAIAELREGGATGLLRLKMDVFSDAIQYVDAAGDRVPCLPPGETVPLLGTGFLTDQKAAEEFAPKTLNVQWASTDGTGRVPDPLSPKLTSVKLDSGDRWSVSGTIAGHPSEHVYNLGVAVYCRRDGFLWEELTATKLGIFEANEVWQFQTTSTAEPFGEYRLGLDFTHQ